MSLNITNYCQYQSAYDSERLRGIDNIKTPRPWDLREIIQSHSDTDKILLDIGCGTAFKLIPLAPFFQQIIGIDPSHSMLQAAQRKIQNTNIANITIKAGYAENLPIADHSIDVVTVMLSRWNASEIHRVLKPNGVAIIEGIGCEDKKAFKLFFGKDKIGWRGQFLDHQVDDFLTSCKQHFTEYFNTVTIENGFWQTFYTESGLKQLLQYTPTIRNYNQQNDQDKLRKAITGSMQDGEICLTQNRILICMQHPRNT